MTRAAAVIGSVGVLVAAWLLLVSMNGALDDERAFRGAVGCAPGSGEAAFRLVGVCALVVVAVCSVAALVLWWRRRGDDTVAVTPAVPATEQVFPGRILGEIPYASGTSRKGYLVAGPARLVATPDRTGAADRRQVPPTLTPIRVRPPYWTDPARAEYAQRSLVLECEDDGVRVLVVTRRKHMPWVLGVLQPTPCANSSGRRNTDVP